MPHTRCAQPPPTVARHSCHTRRKSADVASAYALRSGKGALALHATLSRPQLAPAHWRGVRKRVHKQPCCVLCTQPHRRAFAGYLSEDLGFSLELVQKASPPEIRVGSGFRHYTVAVPSIEAAISRATERGLGIVEGTRFEQGEVYIRVRASATAVRAVALSSCAAHALLRPGPVPQPPLS